MSVKEPLTTRCFAVDSFTDEAALKAALAAEGVGLTPYEARRLAELLGRNPTLTELQIFNAEWSEHCSYKSSKPTLKEFLPTEGPTVIQGPQEDAGILLLCELPDGDKWGIVIAHESHNHPSQVLPVEGAATGIGGIVRDVDCMGAHVIAAADPLRFGDPTGPNAERTRWIVGGVVDGIWQYGNALGVPNLGGDVYFDRGYDDNCLVNVVALGLVKQSRIIHSAVPPEAKHEPYDLILVGKPTDDSGFGGAAFSSVTLDESDEDFNRGAVQVPDPFLKNVLLMHKANEAVREAAHAAGVAVGMKDLGAAGIACSTSELCASGGFGAWLDLDRVHVGLDNLLAEVIAVAETQERYVWAVPRSFTPTVLRIYNEDWELPAVYEGAQASVIGEVLTDPRFVVCHRGERVCDAAIDDVVAGILYQREAAPLTWEESEPEVALPDDLGALILTLMGSPNLCSREPIYRFYDTEVQGAAVLRPGEADAGVLAPLPGEPWGVALSVDGNPRYGRIDPYWGGVNAVAEAMRNVAAVGATPVGMTDCLNFGNPEVPSAFWQFRESVRGIGEAAAGLSLKDYPGHATPFVSGNVSLYNQSAAGNAVAPSPIIACVGVIDDYSRCVTMQLKTPGNVLILAGARRDELGGSAYYQVAQGCHGANLPRPDLEVERALIHGTIDAIATGAVASCHDIADGGLVAALAEMMIGGWGHGQCGATLELSKVPFSGDVDDTRRLLAMLFGESGGFLLEVPADRAEAVLGIYHAGGAAAAVVGQVTADAKLVIDGEVSATVALDELREAWCGGLTKVLG